MTTSGTFRVCPVSQSSATKGLVKDKEGRLPRIQSGISVQQVLNSESLRNLRERMMSGQDVSDTCGRCINEEANQVASRRQLELQKFPQFDKAFVQQWTEPAGGLKAESPVWMVILRLGNRCNLMCRMCGPSSSSAWYKEWHETRHKGFTEDEKRISLQKNQAGVFHANPNVYEWSEEETVLSFIRSCGQDLKRLHFSGGEPLLSQSHLPILRQLAESGLASQMTLEYNTNLTVLPEEVLHLWSKFQFVELGISVDGPPVVNEYIRYPLKTEKFLANLQRLDRSRVKGNFWISTTVQIYNILSLQALQGWLKEQNFKKIHAKISWHILRAPHELSIFALPEKAKNEIARILKSDKEFSSIADIIFSQDHSPSFPEFYISTQKMDQFRNQTYKSLKELDEFLTRTCS